MVKFGFKKGFQRYQCRVCKRTQSDIPENPLGNLRVPFEKAAQVVALLCEGTGIRASERLTGLNRRTVLGILQTAGQKAVDLMEEKVLNLQLEQVQADELVCFVKTKQVNTLPDDDQHGSFFNFLSVDRASKLIINWHIGKRTHADFELFLTELRNRVQGRFQLSTDAYGGYAGKRGAVRQVFGNTIDYGTEKKYFEKFNGINSLVPYAFRPKQVVCATRKRQIGNPDMSQVTTSHTERTNLSVRIFTRRFTRCTLGYSKTLENLKYALALFVAHFNFCRVHSAHKMTPANAAKLTDHNWTVEELLNWKSDNQPATAP